MTVNGRVRLYSVQKNECSAARAAGTYTGKTQEGYFMIGLLAFIVSVAGLAATGIGLYGVMNHLVLGEIFLVGFALSAAALILASIGVKISGKLLSLIALVVGIVTLIGSGVLFFLYDGVEFFKSGHSLKDYLENVWTKFKYVFQGVKDEAVVLVEQNVNDTVDNLIPGVGR